jgi:RES domain-containing protein
MNRPRTLAERIASIGGVEVKGAFLRHAAPNRDAFAGGYAGRWGESIPVVYLGRPLDSCVEEAYRHLVDEAGVPAHLVRPRTLYQVRVEVENVLDLCSEQARTEVGLADADIASPVGDYAACQRVAAVAHQLEYHGIIAPAATGLGETLALFRQRVGIAELPVVVDQRQWNHLPPRPGTAPARLTAVTD